MKCEEKMLDMTSFVWEENLDCEKVVMWCPKCGAIKIEVRERESQKRYFDSLPLHIPEVSK